MRVLGFILGLVAVPLVLWGFIALWSFGLKATEMSDTRGGE
jgi:hypothetical protein